MVLRDKWIEVDARGNRITELLCQSYTVEEDLGNDGIEDDMNINEHCKMPPIIKETIKK